MLKDRQHKYGLLARAFHWLSAFIIFWQFAKFFDRIGDGEHWVANNIASFHISIGAIFLVVIAARLLWTLSQQSNRPVNPETSSFLAKLGHFGLYVLMIAMPVTGICYMAGKGYGVDVFGWEVIAGGPKTDWLISIGELHSPLAWLLLVTVVGHIGMVIKHRLTGDKALLLSMR